MLLYHYIAGAVIYNPLNAVVSSLSMCPYRIDAFIFNGDPCSTN